MAMQKEDYVKLGQQHAEQRLKAKHPFPRTGKSWQALAYWEGVNGTPVVEVPRKPMITSAAIDSYFAKWPQAAREHVKKLCVELQAEKSTQRHKRLMRAVRRMCKRYEELVLPYEDRIEARTKVLDEMLA